MAAAEYLQPSPETGTRISPNSEDGSLPDQPLHTDEYTPTLPMTLGEPKEIRFSLESTLQVTLCSHPDASANKATSLEKERRLSTNQQAESATVRSAQDAGRDTQDTPSSSKPKHN